MPNNCYYYHSQRFIITGPLSYLLTLSPVFSSMAEEVFGCMSVNLTVLGAFDL